MKKYIYISFNYEMFDGIMSKTVSSIIYKNFPKWEYLIPLRIRQADCVEKRIDKKQLSELLSLIKCVKTHIILDIRHSNNEHESMFIKADLRSLEKFSMEITKKFAKR